MVVNLLKLIKIYRCNSWFERRSRIYQQTVARFLNANSQYFLQCKLMSQEEEKCYFWHERQFARSARIEKASPQMIPFLLCCFLRCCFLVLQNNFAKLVNWNIQDCDFELSDSFRSVLLRRANWIENKTKSAHQFVVSSSVLLASLPHCQIQIIK